MPAGDKFAAAAISFDRATIGGVVDRLEQKGLLEREVSPDDRRARLLRLTGAGRRQRAAFLALARKALGLA